MPIWEFRCKNKHARDVFDHKVEYVDKRLVLCRECGNKMKRVMSMGRGLLYFEEGRGRWIHNLGDKPVYITSRKQHREAMKRAGVAEAPAIPDNTKLTGRASEKGRWV